MKYKLYDFFQKDGFGYIIPNETVYITDCPKDLERLEIPSQIDGVPVTALYQSALDYTINTLFITLPEGMVEIGEEAFAHSGVKEVNLPSSLKLIKKYAFKDCADLKKIDLPDHAAIQTPLFSGCRSLEEINVTPSNDIFVSTDGVLFTKWDIKLVTYPQGKTDLTYAIPNETRAVFPAAFIDNCYLEAITFPNKLYDVFAYAFSGCVNLKSVSLNEDIKNIGDFAFAQSGIKSIDIPRGAEMIGEYAFANCVQLKKLNILAEDAAIKEGAFANCISMESAAFFNPLKYIGRRAFMKCVSLRDIVFPAVSSLEVAEETFRGCSALREVSVSEGIESIADGAFADSGLKTIRLPSTLRKVGRAFSNCHNLETILYNGSPDKWKEIFFETDESVLAHGNIVFTE